jgi:hypothetical protein
MSNVSENHGAENGLVEPEPLLPPKWLPLAYDQSEKIGARPNWVFFSGKDVVIVIRQARNGEGFALSEQGAHYFRNAILAGRVASCTIRLVDRNDSVVGERSLDQVIAKLNSAIANPGRYGSDYFWLDRDFNVSSLGYYSQASPEWL